MKKGVFVLMNRSATYQWLLAPAALLAAILIAHDSACMTTNNSFDPYPLYSTANPHEFLYTVKKDQMRGFLPEYENERANFSITLFGGRATDAIDVNKHFVELGDIHGRWNMLALTFSACPNQPLPDLLATASNQLFCQEPTSVTDPTLIFGDTPNITSTQVTLNISEDYFGKVSVPAEYRKVGVRFEAALMILENFGAKIQGGFADVQQTPTFFIDLSSVNLPTTPTSGNCEPDLCCQAENLSNVNLLLTGTNAIKRIANEINLDVSTYHKTGIEDIRGYLFWRHAFPMNYDREGWPRFLFVPFAQLIGTLAIAEKINPNRQFAVPLGNNGHDSVGFNAGFTIEFDDTMDIGVEAGGTFFSREQITGLRVPVNEFQSSIFLCTADVCRKPGHNWHFIGTLNARRFVDKLSAFLQFAIISHNRDKIDLLVANDEINANLNYLENQTRFDLRCLNLALNYEISPHISLGGLWQAKLGRRNAPRVNTLYASFVANY